MQVSVSGRTLVLNAEGLIQEAVSLGSSLSIVLYSLRIRQTPEELPLSVLRTVAMLSMMRFATSGRFIV